MNISQAKEQIINAVTAYFTRDEFGNYRIPTEKQRPVFMIGPPGVGKTAIMEQVAAEMGVGLVSYSMTHHTRQSALGLPYITDSEYEGAEYRVSEYTMSEIIGSVYKLMKETGVKEGILFLDEINCISETLAPCMLQFLQYKVFGQHRIPKGWLVVTAGNPPEYNKSVRDFDIVTWDRLKRIDVDPDYEVWKEYAYRRAVHPSVTTYLSVRKKDFYKVETTVDGKHFVTARGWDDLSEMIKLYEENGINVDELLICQYLQDPRIAKDFAIYYDLFNKYRSDYQVEAILAGTEEESILFRAEKAKLDERLSLLGLLFDAAAAGLRSVCEMEDALEMTAEKLREFKEKKTSLPELIEGMRRELDIGIAASSMSQEKRQTYRRVIGVLEEERSLVMKAGAEEGDETFDVIKEDHNRRVEDLRSEVEHWSGALENVFSFCEKAFEEGDEILIFITELTVNYYTARFIGHYGCDKYYLHNKELRFQERNRDLIRRADELDLSL